MSCNFSERVRYTFRNQLKTNKMIQKEDVLKVAKDLNFVTPTEEQIQFCINEIDRQADADPTGYWKIWVEDLLHEQEIEQLPRESKKIVSNHIEIEKARALLKENGYQVDNLWSIGDVQGKFKCTDQEAMDVLINAFKNEATIEQIWLSIDYRAEDLGLEKIKKD